MFGFNFNILGYTEVGHAVSQRLLGQCYAEGEGVEQDDALAVAWWEKSSVSGDGRSQYNVGECYTNGTRGWAVQVDSIASKPALTAPMVSALETIIS